MLVKLTDLTPEERIEVQDAYRSNGLYAKDVNIHKDGERIAIEIKASGQIVRIK